MGFPLMVTVGGLRSAFAAGHMGTLSDTLLRPQNRYCWQPIMTWGGSQFLEENMLFMLAVTKYQQAPTKAAMDYIYNQFVGNTHTKTTAPREINISAPAKERCWELQTGARTKSAPGGCRADVFAPALEALGLQLYGDMNLRFSGTLNENEARQYRMAAGQADLLDKDIDGLKKVGIVL